MSNLIDRQAAISAICNACGKIDCDKMDKCEKLQLPPANCSEFPNNSDTISRQAAIDAVLKCYDNDEMFEVYERELKELPSAEPEPKRGKWLDANICGELPVIVCNQCKTFYPLSFGEFHNFCPNCGADMREVKT